MHVYLTLSSHRYSLTAPLQLRDQRKVIDDMQDELSKTEKDNVKKDEVLIVLATKLRAEQQAHALQVR